MATRWVTLLGPIQVEDEEVVYGGGSAPAGPTGEVPAVGITMASELFGAGTVSARCTFTTRVTSEGSVGFILYRHPSTQAFISAQLGGANLCSVWSFATQWHQHAFVGFRSALEPNRPYEFAAYAVGSSVAISLDGVEVLTARLPVPLPYGPAGLIFRGPAPIRVSDFKVRRVKPTAFVVMQFTPPYNESYTDVIKPVCDSLGLRAIRADDTFGPGVIIRDIERQILEARVVIADITPANLNVYYEVGYAHAVGKDTILVAEKPTQVPFDVSPFRVLFYDNTIAGKSQVESGLRKHLAAILGEHDLLLDSE